MTWWPRKEGWVGAEITAKREGGEGCSDDGPSGAGPGNSIPASTTLDERRRVAARMVAALPSLAPLPLLIVVAHVAARDAVRSCPVRSGNMSGCVFCAEEGMSIFLFDVDDP